MSFRGYLPSGRFASFVFAILISVALIAGAEYATTPWGKQAPVLSAGAGGPSAASWQGAAAAAIASPDTAHIADEAQSLLQAVGTNNLTDTLGRSLLINTASAEGQGLGEDANTQDAIVSSALSQLQSTQTAQTPYQSSDIGVVADSTDALHQYGNALVAVLSSHPHATYTSTMSAVGLAIDNNNAATLQKLPGIATEYRALAADIVALPTPVSLAPEALAIANNYAQMGDTCGSMEQVLADPARGLLGIQTYSSLYNANLQVFTQIAEVFQNNAILFTKDESGAVWSSFLTAQQNAPPSATQN